jgi:hypothetical protein
MSQTVSFNLAFILFFPTFCVIAALYCWLPTRPRSAARWIMDISVITIALVLSLLAMGWGFHRAAGVGAPIWQQAASTLAAYAMFLAVLAIGLTVRNVWFKRLRFSKAPRSLPQR